MARGGEGNWMRQAQAGTPDFREILVRKEGEFRRSLRQRDDIAIQKSADQMDEIQYAAERDMAMRNVDRSSTLHREVKAALARLEDGTFGVCVDCEEEISPKRLAALPWATRCIRCQETADSNGQENADTDSETLVHAA